MSTIVKFKRLQGSDRYNVNMSGVKLCFKARLKIRYVLVGAGEEFIDTYTFFRPAFETIILHGIYSYAISNRS